MTEAGADIVVAHMGLTAKGSVGAEEAMTLEAAAETVQRLSDAAKDINPDVLTICHGGSIAEPDDARFMLQQTDGVVGFFSASSIERLPTERAIE